MKHLTLAYSSCPNDTFIFYALAHKLLNQNDTLIRHNSNIIEYSDELKVANELEFEINIADVETLNKYAAISFFDITKLSFATFGALRDKYALLKTGSALGRGCGPLIISLPEKMKGGYINLSNLTSMALLPIQKSPINAIYDKKLKVAVPGFGTTAFVLFKLFMKENFPDVEPDITAMPFENIMEAVKDGVVDWGVVIHEGRFIYKKLGLDSIVDLGEWWERFTSLPIPLGCIAIKRAICKNHPEIASIVQSLIGQSIQYAFENPESTKSYIKKHAQELDDEVINQHIHLYVNDFSKDIGTEGEAAILTFFQKAEEAGIIERNNLPIFAC